MSPLREQLLGYLLGALEDHEVAEIEQQLARSPAVRDELEKLKAALFPLETGRQDYEPAANLAERTCELVAANRAARDELPTPASREPFAIGALDPAYDSPAPARSVHWLETLVTVGVCTTLAVLFFPALLNSRELARRIYCQNNLRLVGVSIESYDDKHLSIPYIPLTGPFAFAGFYGPTLRHHALLDEESRLLCPGTPHAHWRNEFQIPSLQTLEMASPEELCRMRATAGGTYGFHLGVLRDGRHCAPTLSELTHCIILADAPDYLRPNFISSNHGGRGINVLFGNLQLRFLTGCEIPSPNGADNIYVNRDYYIAPGHQESDSVIALSPIAPRVISGAFRSH